jgi:hypothetical protein
MYILLQHLVDFVEMLKRRKRFHAQSLQSLRSTNSIDSADDLLVLDNNDYFLSESGTAMQQFHAATNSNSYSPIAMRLQQIPSRYHETDKGKGSRSTSTSTSATVHQIDPLPLPLMVEEGPGRNKFKVGDKIDGLCKLSNMSTRWFPGE